MSQKNHHKTPIITKVRNVYYSNIFFVMGLNFLLVGLFLFLFVAAQSLPSGKNKMRMKTQHLQKLSTAGNTNSSPIPK
ncbi:MAG: hypothetical protein HOE90_03395 [Bacteriovoracaceae bacterium]|jgi:hypothetical protein|nr:hypothetical protein [Bacteriovoracaceae bacterium]